MTSPSTLSWLTALMLLVTACGDGPTESDAKAARQRDASPDPAPVLSSVTAQPPLLEINMVPGNSSLYGYGPWKNDVGSTVKFVVTGTRFPPGRSYDSRMIAVFNDGFVISLGGAGGVITQDGGFRMDLTTQCPSRIREVYQVLLYEGQRAESKHVVPMC